MIKYLNMPLDKNEIFNTQNLLNEINVLIQTGLSKTLDKFISDYNNYESTYNHVMNIPAVKKLIDYEKYIYAKEQSNSFTQFSIQIDKLTKENKSLRVELEKYESGEHISLNIVENVNQSAEELSKIYETILDKETDIKRLLINNMFKVPACTPLTSEDENESEAKQEETESDAETEVEVKQEEVESETESDAETEVEVKHEEVESETEFDTETEAEAKQEETESDTETEVEFKQEETESEVEVKQEETESEVEVKQEEVETEVEVKQEEVETEAEEEDVFEIEIDDITYFTNDEENGNIYEADKNGDPGNKIGYLKGGEPFFIII